MNLRQIKCGLLVEEWSWEQWGVGDIVIWDDATCDDIKQFTIKDLRGNYVYWIDPETGLENMTRRTHLMRVVGTYQEGQADAIQC